jgi:hypothetical protein
MAARAMTTLLRDRLAPLTPSQGMVRWTRRGAVVGTVLLLAACAGQAPPLPEERHSFGPLPVDQGEAGALVSDYRRAHGLGAVSADADLQRVAQAQADAMASANLLSHSVAGSLPDRLSVYGASRRAAVENVSAGYADLAAALGGWRRSPPHNANLLFTPMRRIGVAAASAPGTRYKTFWALVMTN